LLSGRKPTPTGIAAQTNGVVVSHKVSRARLFRRFHEKLSIRTDRLKTVVLYDNGLARQISEEKGHKRGACDMKDISPTNQSPELAEIRLADNSERKHVIFEIVRASLCYDGEVKLGGTVGLAKIGKAASQGQNDRFDAADTGCKKVRVDQELHPGLLRSK